MTATWTVLRRPAGTDDVQCLEYAYSGTRASESGDSQSAGDQRSSLSLQSQRDERHRLNTIPADGTLCEARSLGKSGPKLLVHPECA